MDKHQDLEARLRSYLAEGARMRQPAGMEDRIASTVFRSGHSWAFQVLAAAAVLVVAIGLGIGLNKARQLGGLVVKPTPSPSVATSPTASATPSGKPSPSASATPRPGLALYPLMVPASMHVVSATTTWAAGSTTDRVLRTTDGGAHWNDVTPSQARLGTWITFFLDANNAWLASSVEPGSATNDFTVEIYRTTNGGSSWQRAGNVTPAWGFPAAIDFVDGQHGWLFMKQAGNLEPLYSDLVAIYGTVDGGANWVKLSESDASGIAGHLPQACPKTSLVFLNGSTGWIDGGCGPGGGYFLEVSRDGGRNWSAVSLRIPDQGSATCDCSIEGLRFWDQQHGALVLENAYQDAGGYAQNFLYTTSDGGRSWQLGPRLPNNSFSVYFLDAEHGWSLNAKANALLFSGDGGQHWSTVATIPTNSNGVVEDFQFVTSQVGWALGADSKGLPILKTVDGGQTWTIQLAP